MVATLENNPAASPADLVSAAAIVDPRASGILTSGSAGGFSSIEQEGDFLIDELQIGDLESTLADMKSQMGQGSPLSEEERNMIFQAAVELQKTITAKKAGHTPKPYE